MFFNPSNFEGAIIYDVSLFHIHFSFISHELAVLKLLESQCAALNGRETGLKYQASYWTEKLQAAKEAVLKSTIPESVKTAKNLFWSELNFACSIKTDDSLFCKDAWSQKTVTYYWDIIFPLVEATHPRKHNMFFADDDFGDDDDTANNCSGKAYFYYAKSDFFNPGGYFNCSRVSWTSGGECRKFAVNSLKLRPSGTTCGVSPRRIYLNAAQDLWHNYTNPLLLMVGETAAPNQETNDANNVKNVTFDGKPCLRWETLKEEIAGRNWDGLSENYCRCSSLYV